MGNVAGVNQEFGLGLEGFDPIKGDLQGGRDIRVRWLVESHMAVAQLHEAQLAVHFLLGGFTERVGTENSALHNAKRARPRPSHAFQKSSAINAVMVVVVVAVVVVVVVVLADDLIAVGWGYWGLVMLCVLRMKLAGAVAIPCETLGGSSSDASFSP